MSDGISDGPQNGWEERLRWQETHGPRVVPVGGGTRLSNADAKVVLLAEATRILGRHDLSLISDRETIRRLWLECERLATLIVATRDSRPGS